MVIRVSAASLVYEFGHQVYPRVESSWSRKPQQFTIPAAYVEQALSVWQVINQSCVRLQLLVVLLSSFIK